MVDNNTTEGFESLSSTPDIDFGINSVESISSEELDSMIFGEPADATPIEKKDPKKEVKVPSKEEPKEEPKEVENIEKDLLNQLFEDKEEHPKDDSELTPKTKEIKDKEDEEETNTFAVLTKDLLDLGVFTTDEDEEETPVTTPEEFRDRFLKEVSVQANSQIYNFLAQKHGEKGLEVFDALFVKGISPEDYLSKHAQIESLQNLDLSREDNQERVYRTYYKKLGWSDETIDSKIAKLKDYGDLEEEAATIHEKLIVQEKAAEQDLIKSKEQEDLLKNQRRQVEAQTYNNILVSKLKDKEFDGIPLTDKVAREAFAELTQERFQLSTGQRITEFDNAIRSLNRPENYETKVKLWLLLRSGMDLSKVKTSAVSKKSEALFNNLAIKEKTTKRINTLPTNNNFGVGL